MMVRKKIILISFVFVALSLSILLLRLLNNRSHPEPSSATVSFNEIKEKLANNAGTFNYEDYFEIVQVEFMIDMDKGAIRHLFIMKNISGRELAYNFQIYKEQKLIDKYLSGLSPAMPFNTEMIVLETDKRSISTMYSEFLWPSTSFDEREWKEIIALAGKLYVELQIDGKYDYFVVEAKQVDSFNEY